jgi:calcium-dependent protein kinase
VSITDVVEKRRGKVPLLGRYHEMPRKLEHDFKMTGEVVGSGCSGSVKKAVRINAPDSAEKFAVKTFSLRRLSASSRVSLEAEAQIFLCLDHPHIARLINVYQTPESLSLVMECMVGGELFDRVVADKFFLESQAANVTEQMLLAVHYLHCHGIVHRDLKLENFIYEEKGGDLLKLIDFGFSKFRERGAKMKTGCGTLSYVAPEVLSDSYTSQCDLWSLGVIVFILLSGSMPFSSDSSSARDKIAAGEYFMKKEKWARVSADGIAFMKALLRKDPNVRFTAEEALNHRWLQRYKRQAIVEPEQSIVAAFQQYSKAPRFRRCCLIAMAWLLTNKETETVREEFIAIDTDRQGTISLGELRAVMVNKFSVRDADVVNIFQAMDMNHDDEIHYSEFLAAMLSTRVEVNDQLLESTFRNFDKDLTGYITIENLRDSLGSAFEGQQVETLLEEVDVLKEGRISFPEFAAYVRGTPVESQSVQLSYPPGMPPVAPKRVKSRQDERVEVVQQPCCNIM